MHLQFIHILLVALTQRHTLMAEMLLDAYKNLLCSLLCTWKMDVCYGACNLQI